MVRRIVGLLLLVAAAVLAGCASPPQAPIDLGADRLAGAKGKKVGVVMSVLPRPNTEFPGAGCLLCIAVAEAAHGKLTTQVQSLSTSELLPLKADLAQLLRQQGLEPVVIDAPLDLDSLPDRSGAADGFARKDFSTLRSRHGLDRLLVVQIDALGVWRQYSAYIPQAPPRAVVRGSGFLVDLDSHRLDWLARLDVSRAAEGEWDEAPRFPGLTNAYYQALEQAMDQLRQPFRR